MRILVINTDYPNFLRTLYRGWPGLAGADYQTQMAARNDSLFGVADYYSKNFIKQGHDAVEVHVNNRMLQFAWAREHGLTMEAPASCWENSATGSRRLVREILKSIAKSLLTPLLRKPRPHRMPAWEAALLAAQISQFKPDIILNQEMGYIDNGTLKGMKPARCRLIGQIAAPLPANTDFSAYDLVISSLPNLVDWFRRHGFKAELNRLAFEPSILDKLGPQPVRDIDLSFVGSLSPEHRGRIRLLETIAAQAPLKIWGNGMELLPRSSPLHACYQGEAWGRDMYAVLRRSRITLNNHLDLAGPWANNMRLYEATGMGTLLLTDAKQNLAEIFTPGEEVADYRDAEDCVAQIHRYLKDEGSRAAIAAAGQHKAITVQNYAGRTAEIAALAQNLA
ncbi:MAG TPA: glycosyltransferase [Rhizomicrobium sp.]|nr:glycosyltransferase [Rhizomicrobium sp.]